MPKGNIRHRSWCRGQRLLRTAIAGIAAILLVAEAGQAQQGNHSALVEKMNANTILLETAGSGLSYGPFAYDLADLLNDGDNLRILPVQGHSSFQNVKDIRYLRGIDMGFVQSSSLGYYRRSGDIPDVVDKLVFLFKVCNNEIHLIVHSNITSIQQLRGQKVNFNQDGSGTQLAARTIFQHFGVKVQEVNMRQGDAIEELRNDRIAATVVLTSKPASELGKLRANEGWHILPIAFDNGLLGDFVPTAFTHDDYPNLVPEGATVDSLADSVLVMAFNWPKNSDHYQRLNKFINAFFPRLADFQKPPHHVKWKDTNLTATLPGWQRFAGAEEWLKNARDQELGARREQFEQFLASRDASGGRQKALSEAERNALFEDFMKWVNTPTVH